MSCNQPADVLCTIVSITDNLLGCKLRDAINNNTLMRTSVRYELCVSHNSKTDKVNLIKLHRKVKLNEKVCRAQNLGSHDQGQSHN